MSMNPRRAMVWLVVGLLALALAACGGLVGRPEIGYPSTGGQEAGPGEVVTGYPALPTEEPAKGDEEGLEALGGGYEWRRVGGIAGFCDVVIVDATGATVTTCRVEPPEIRAELVLTAEQVRQMQIWLEEFAPFEHEQSDGATADGMTTTLTFAGQGDGEPTDEDIAAMEALVMELMRGAADR